MEYTVKQITGHTKDEIQKMTLPARIALQDKLTYANNHTAVLIICAVFQNNKKVLDGLLVVYAFQQEFGELTHELNQFRTWLASLLVK